MYAIRSYYAKGKANSLVAQQIGLNKPFELNGHQAAFVVLGDEEPSQNTIKKLEKVPFLVVQASYQSALTAKADVVLPVTAWLEQSGYYVTCDGKVQIVITSYSIHYTKLYDTGISVWYAMKLLMNSL